MAKKYWRAELLRSDMAKHLVENVVNFSMSRPHGSDSAMVADVAFDTFADETGKEFDALEHDEVELLRAFTEHLAHFITPKCPSEPKIQDDIKRATAISKSWSSGNFANAYLPHRHDVAQVPLDLVDDTDLRSAFLAGFYSSYEEDELPAAHDETILEARKHFSDLNEIYGLGIADD